MDTHGVGMAKGGRVTNEVGPNSTLRDETGGGDERQVPRKPHLFVVLEADRPQAGGARYSLSDIDEVVLRRGDERAAARDTKGGRRRLIVSIPARWMSSEHATLTRGPEGWTAEDTDSKNGTYLAGSRITSARMEDGDVLEAGHAFFALRLSLPTPSGWIQDADSSAFGSLPAWRLTLYPELLAELEALTRVAASNVPVLLSGESGTGKELLARGVHDTSKRSGAFVAVNCGALPVTLIEGLLFGHVKGAFSSAIRDEAGLVRSADGGTLFLDEIGDLPLSAQASLLRVLQEREVLPVGATRPVPVDLRVICATHRPLDALAARGNFRADLLARIDGFRHSVRPLRERREDLGLLVASLLSKLAPGTELPVSFTPGSGRALAAHRWPGNVRELEQVLARALALSKDGVVEASALALKLAAGSNPSDRPPQESDALLKERLTAELARHQGNVSEVARAMGKARMQVQRWIRRFHLDPTAYRKSD